MVALEQVWRERISWLPSSGLTDAGGGKECGVSVEPVCRWKKLLAETLRSRQIPPTSTAAASCSEQAKKNVVTLSLPRRTKPPHEGH